MRLILKLSGLTGSIVVCLRANRTANLNNLPISRSIGSEPGKEVHSRILFERKVIVSLANSYPGLEDEDLRKRVVKPFKKRWRLSEANPLAQRKSKQRDFHRGPHHKKSFGLVVHVA